MGLGLLAQLTDFVPELLHLLAMLPVVKGIEHQKVILTQQGNGQLFEAPWKVRDGGIAGLFQCGTGADPVFFQTFEIMFTVIGTAVGDAAFVQIAANRPPLIESNHTGVRRERLPIPINIGTLAPIEHII